MCIAKCEIFFAVSFSSTSPLRKLRNGISVMEKPVFNLLNVGFCSLFSFSRCAGFPSLTAGHGLEHR